MKATCWMGTREHSRSGAFRTRRSSIRTTPSSASRARRSADRTSTSTTASSRPCSAATCSATSSWAKSSRSAGRATTCASATASSCRSRSRAATARMCERELYSLCENSNPNAWMAEKMWGYSPCGIFGYSHMLGGYAGGQAEYVRVPFADVGPLKVPDSSTTSRCCSSPTSSRPATWRPSSATSSPATSSRSGAAGPVGQFAIKSAYLLGAERVIAIDRFDVPACAWRASGPAPRRSTTRRPTSATRIKRDDRRPRRRRLHRRGRHGGARGQRRGTSTTR